MNCSNCGSPDVYSFKCHDCGYIVSRYDPDFYDEYDVPEKKEKKEQKNDQKN